MQQLEAIPGERDRGFCDRPNDSTRFAQPHRGGCHCGVGDEAAFGIDIAVREAVTNAIVHANNEDDTKSIEVSFNCAGRAFEIDVKDQGEGFDPASVPDPTEPANLLKTSGRGIFLMRNFMDEVQWSSRPEGGTTLHMVKRF